MDKKSKAWRVGNDEGATIIFNNHGLAARREGSEELDAEFDYVECDRARQYDKYSEQGYVPVEVLVKDGWWFECWNCSTVINECMDDFNRVVYAKHGVYCSSECQQARKDKIDNVNQEAFDFYVSLVNGWCKWDITELYGGWPILKPSAKFTFPGAEHGGTVKIGNDRGAGLMEFQVYVANCDRKAYEEWEDK